MTPGRLLLADVTGRRPLSFLRLLVGVGIDEPEVVYTMVGEVVEVVVLEVLQSAAQFHWIHVFDALEFEITFGEGGGQFAPEKVILEFLD